MLHAENVVADDNHNNEIKLVFMPEKGIIGAVFNTRRLQEELSDLGEK